MDRVGITQYVGGNENYDFYGELNKFRTTVEILVKNTVLKDNKWFSFCKVAHEAQIDIMSIKNNKGIKLGYMVGDCFPDSSYRVAIYKYLLHDFMCYYEEPVVKKEGNLNGFKNSYNKYVITSNIHVVAEWLGISLEEAQQKYGLKLSYVEEDDGSEEYQYLKLYSTKGGERKVTCPRNLLDLSQSGIRLVPMFALKSGVDALYSLLQGGTYDVKFLKDGGQERVINTTFYMGKVIDLYGDEMFVKTNFNSIYNGDFTTNSSFERGYIRVFELGASIYNNPTRSINFARIISFEKADPDMSYMYIDLDSVLNTFISSIYNYKWTEGELEEFVNMLDEFDVGSSRTLNKVRIQTVMQIENWANMQDMLLSTVFIRQLALFMIGNPQWFEGYTGQPKASESQSSTGSDGGLLPMDVDDGFSLPLN